VPYALGTNARKKARSASGFGARPEISPRLATKSVNQKAGATRRLPAVAIKAKSHHGTASSLNRPPAGERQYIGRCRVGNNKTQRNPKFPAVVILQPNGERDA
jgi:hypothetical protein